MASHIASIRSSSSARIAKQQRAAAAASSNQSDIMISGDGDDSNILNHDDQACSSGRNVPSKNNLENSQVSQLSVLSLSDDYDDHDHDDTHPEMDSRRSSKSRTKSSSSFNENISTSNKPVGRKQMFPPPLEEINNLEDIESFVHGDSLEQMATLEKLEERWRAILGNFQTVIDHLQESSKEVTDSSTDCLNSLVESVDLTCDKVDAELKALYHLMTKCDELTTKLSVASSFRDEIKTLRKSVETLELLYKSKPQQQGQPRDFNRT